GAGRVGAWGSLVIGKTMDELRSSPRERGEDAGRQMRGSASLQPLAPPLIRPFGPPSPRKRGEGKVLARRRLLVVDLDGERAVPDRGLPLGHERHRLFRHLALEGAERRQRAAAFL